MLEKDIILICKGHYNKDKYKNEYEAMVEYYHRHYSRTNDFIPDKRFLIQLFLKRTLFYILKDDKNETYRFFNNCLFGDCEKFYWYVNNGNTDFYEELFDMLINFILILRVRNYGLTYIEKFDFSEYEQADTMELREVI